jgi:hypothetical protein
LEGTSLAFLNWVGGVETIKVTAPWTPSISTWYHVALVRVGDYFSFYVNGTQVGTTSTDSSPVDDNAGSLRIGAHYYSGGLANVMNGWIDEFRILKGLAAWTANFTAPTTPHLPPLIRATNVSISHLSVDGNMANNNSPVTYLEGIIMLDVTGGTIFDCEAYNCTEVGFNAQGTDYYNPVVADMAQPITVIDCISHDNFYDGFQVVSGLFIGNMSYNNRTQGFNVVSFLSGGINSATTFIGCGSYNNMVGFMTDYQFGGPSVNVVIDGCIIRNNMWGVEIELESTMVKNSLIVYNQEDGVRIEANHTKISGNIIKNNGHGPYVDATNGTQSGIQITGDLTDVEITHNDIYDDQTVKTQKYGITHKGTASLSRVKVKDNNCYGNLTSDIHTQIATAGGTVEDNF